MKVYSILLIAAGATGYYLGGLDPQNACLVEKNKALMDVALAEQRVGVLEREAAASEAEAQSRFLAQKEINRVNQARALVNAATDGLFVNAVCPSGSNPVPSGPTDPARSDGSSRARLSQSDDQFFISVGAEANDVTIQLGRCQEYAVNCHNVCSIGGLK